MISTQANSIIALEIIGNNEMVNECPTIIIGDFMPSSVVNCLCFFSEGDSDNFENVYLRIYEGNSREYKKKHDVLIGKFRDGVLGWFRCAFPTEEKTFNVLTEYVKQYKQKKHEDDNNG